MRLVDELDRTVATLRRVVRNPQDAERQMYRAIEDWRYLGAVGAAVHGECGELVTYA